MKLNETIKAMRMNRGVSKNNASCASSKMKSENGPPRLAMWKLLVDLKMDLRAVEVIEVTWSGLWSK